MVLMLEDNSIHTNSLNSYKLYNRNQYAFQEVSCFFISRLNLILIVTQNKTVETFWKDIFEDVGALVTATSWSIK